MESTGYPETSLINYQPISGKIPEEWRPQPHRGRTLIPRNLTVLQAVKEFPAFFTTKNCNLLPYLKYPTISFIQSQIYRVRLLPSHFFISILILYSHLRRVFFPSGIFPFGFPHQNSVRISVLPPAFHIPFHLIPLSVYLPIVTNHEVPRYLVFSIHL